MAAGSSLTLNASLVGTAALNKGLGGNLILAAPQYTNLSTAYMTISGGTVTLAGGTNTLFPLAQAGGDFQRLVVIVWTPRGEVRRIISLRKANEREIEKFSQALDRPG